tara:strand:- start:186 stop:344 length:159 start_codon:yes stop_codon:yes gene_type:complete
MPWKLFTASRNSSVRFWSSSAVETPLLGHALEYSAAEWGRRIDTLLSTVSTV